MSPIHGHPYKVVVSSPNSSLHSPIHMIIEPLGQCLHAYVCGENGNSVKTAIYSGVRIRSGHGKKCTRIDVPFMQDFSP